MRKLVRRGNPNLFAVWVIPLASAFVAGLLSTRRAIWSDEGATIYRITIGWKQFISLSWDQNDLVHGTYYAILKLLNPIVGENLFAIRSISALSLGLSLLGIARLMSLFAEVKFVITAQILFLLLPSTSSFATEARSVGIATTLVIWLSYLFFVILKKLEHHEKINKEFTLFITLSIFSLFFFIYLAFLQIVFLLHCLIRKNRQPFKIFLLAALITFVATLPFTLQASLQTGQIGWLKSNLWKSITDALTVATPSRFGLLAFVGSFCIILLILTLIQKKERLSNSEKSLILWAFLVITIPAIIIISLSEIKPLFTQRYLVPFTPGFAILAAIALLKLAQHRAQIVSALLVIVSLLSIGSNFGTSGRDYWGDKIEIVKSKSTGNFAIMASQRHYERVFFIQPIPRAVVLHLSDSIKVPEVFAAVPRVDISSAPNTIFLISSKIVEKKDLLLLQNRGYKIFERYKVGPGAIIELRK